MQRSAHLSSQRGHLLRLDVTVQVMDPGPGHDAGSRHINLGPRLRALSMVIDHAHLSALDSTNGTDWLPGKRALRVLKFASARLCSPRACPSCSPLARVRANVHTGQPPAPSPLGLWTPNVALRCHTISCTWVARALRGAYIHSKSLRSGANPDRLVRVEPARRAPGVYRAAGVAWPPTHLPQMNATADQWCCSH